MKYLSRKYILTIISLLLGSVLAYYSKLSYEYVTLLIAINSGFSIADVIEKKISLMTTKEITTLVEDIVKKV